MTSAAPRWRRQSVKPPVEAPASRARRPATGTGKRSSAASSFSPPRPTKRGPGPTTSTACPGSTRWAGFEAGAPPTSTRPAATASRACSRVGARPRRTSSTSRRRRRVSRSGGRGLLGRLPCARRLPGRGLLGARRLLGRRLPRAGRLLGGLGGRLLGPGGLLGGGLPGAGRLAGGGSGCGARGRGGAGAEAVHRVAQGLDVVAVGQPQRGHLLADLVADGLQEPLGVLAALLEDLLHEARRLLGLHLAC